jgi:CubicO group peptidase (beta-lactamase class C family)
MKKLLFIALLTSASCISVQASPPDGRPPELTLSNFQFGPVNRWSFSHLREVLPTANIEHDGRQVLKLDRSKADHGNVSISFRGEDRPIDDIADEFFVDGILLLRGNQVLFEKYYGHGAESKPHLMNSISKSLVGLVAGKLAADGLIDLDKTVAHYVPALAESGWGPDTLRTVLDMRDGSDYTEDYPDFGTTFRLQDCAIGWTDADYCPEDGPKGGYNFFPTIPRNPDKVGKFSYRSGSTDVMGWVLEAAAGQPLAELISRHLWKPMGAEFDANITVDSSGFPLADHGVSASLRDLGRVGLLILNRGKADGRQVIPAEFIDDMLVQSGDADWPYGQIEGVGQYYRSYWWGSIGNVRALSGFGIHGQTIRVVPESGTVVVIYSTWPLADGKPGKDLWWELDDIALGLEGRFSE